MSKKYTEDHEWLDIAGDSATVGITQRVLRVVGDAHSGAVASNVQPLVVFGVFFAHGVVPLSN